MKEKTSSIKPAKILLEDGTLLKGRSFAADGTVYAEIVFNTGMTGYQEILTDPSYAGQVVVMTYPLIGNYGIAPGDVESSSIQVSGLVVRDFCNSESNWKSHKNIADYLLENNIMGISDIDTRMLTKKIRNMGTMNCLITSYDITPDIEQELKSFKFPTNIVNSVSRKTKDIIQGSGKSLAIIDTGLKNGIIKHFSKLNCNITIYPWDVSAEEILNNNYDAIMLSNGPGDPKDATATIETVQQLIGKMPIFGICLGHQIMALALGGNTYKLKFGHRGSNHPVIELDTGKVFITAQNHGYAVCKENLPACIKVTHLNVNDDTVEGFSCPDLDIYTVQFHPEAGPGPVDANLIFEEWVNFLEKIKG